MYQCNSKKIPIYLKKKKKNKSNNENSYFATLTYQCYTIQNNKSQCNKRHEGEVC